MDVRDRVAGGVLGLALGDALGAPFEFLRAVNVPEPVPALELPWMEHPPGSTTDDTAMARNLVRSLVAQGGFDPEDLIRRHLEWFRTDPPDVGTLTRRVLKRVARGQDPFEAARAVWEERGPEVSAGNGSAMYCAPLGLAYARRPDELIALAPTLSALTHTDGRCRTAVLSVTLAAAALVRGEDPLAAVRSSLEAVEDMEGGEELAFLTDAVGRERAIDGPDQGFCLFSAALGLQTVARFRAFEAGLRHVVSLGGDTDTNGAIAGALLGALAGERGLPPAWIERLRDAPAIRAEAEGLIPLAERT
jgi:ADP-ribosyl-[dinitrogen reductase] hydrolase